MPEFVVFQTMGILVPYGIRCLWSGLSPFIQILFNILWIIEIVQDENKKQGNLSRNRLSSFFPLLRKAMILLYKCKNECDFIRIGKNKNLIWILLSTLHNKDLGNFSCLFKLGWLYWKQANTFDVYHVLNSIILIIDSKPWKTCL